MLVEPNNLRQRVAVAKTVLDMMQVYSKAYVPEKQVADAVVDVLIGCAVFVGQVENRLVTASDISAMTGISRSTVIRRFDRNPYGKRPVATRRIRP